MNAISARLATLPWWRLFRVAVFYGGLLFAWWAIAEAEVYKSYVFPPPEKVWDTLWARLQDGRLLDAIGTTMQRMAMGYSLSIVIGLTLGVAMGAFRWVDETLGTLVLGLQSLPSIAWFPLAILWFGLDEKAIIFVVLMGSVNAIAISVRSGALGVPVNLQRAGQMFGANRLQLIAYVIVPGMLPSVVAGLKLGWSFAWRSLLAAELLFVSTSLGYLLQTGRDLNQVHLVIAVMLVVVALGIIFDRLVFARAEKWIAGRWGLAGA